MRAIRVQFKPVGKRYFFGLGNYELHDGMEVVVSTIRGLELGWCVGEPFELDNKDLTSELKDVIRIATENDKEKFKKNKSEEADVITTTKNLAKKYKLQMKVLESEYTLDKSKLIIYFESEARVDFRELVKDLAEVYHTRIELRQVGSRDSAKTFGGIGPCGLILCCKTFITQFDNVTVKMAKNQNLSLNPVKISGNCGKLLCCINYEDKFYKEMRRNTPDVGDIVETPNGEAKVLSSDVIGKNLKVKYLSEEGGFGYFKFNDVKIKVHKQQKDVYEEDIDNELDL